MRKQMSSSGQHRLHCYGGSGMGGREALKPRTADNPWRDRVGITLIGYRRGSLIRSKAVLFRGGIHLRRRDCPEQGL